MKFEEIASRSAGDGGSSNASPFEVDMANPVTVRAIQPESLRPGVSGGDKGFYMPEAKVTLNDQGPIASISMPPGWTELTPPGSPAGANVFRMPEGTTFVPPGQEANPSAKIHIGPGRENVPPEAEAAFQQLLQSKPATAGPQEVTPQEFQSVAGIIAAFDGGNNQFAQNGGVAPKFDVTGASTVNINGRTGLLVTGQFLEGAAAGQTRESIYFDNSQSGDGRSPIQQLYLTGSPDMVQKYDHQFQNTAESICWKQ